jgi:hypothetical protein
MVSSGYPARAVKKVISSTAFLQRNFHMALALKATRPFAKPGVDVMITIFSNFSKFSAKKLASFSKTNVMSQILQKLAEFCTKNAKFFGQMFLRKYFENHYIGPIFGLQWPKLVQEIKLFIPIHTKTAKLLPKTGQNLQKLLSYSQVHLDVNCSPFTISTYRRVPCLTQLSVHCNGSCAAKQGCQIFIDTISQNGGKYRGSSPEVYQITTKLPNGHKT